MQKGIILTDVVMINCINKTDRTNAHERIRSIGSANRWKLSLSDAIAGIEQGKWSFYVSMNGRSVSVVIAKSADGRKYLKTLTYGEQPDNLLSLPECP